MAKTAFVFPGQGSQVLGMGKDFYENFSESKRVYEEASDTTHLNLKKLCFDGPLEQLTYTENLQPALFTTEVAILRAFQANYDVKPVVTAGHSLGEYSALVACGSLTLGDGVKLTRLRGAAMQNAVPVGRGTMAAILGLTGAQVAALCRKATAANPNEVVEPANYNAPGQVVIAGSVDGVAKAMALLGTDLDFKGGKSIPLQVSAPFHCSLMKPAQTQMAPELSATRFVKSHCWIIPNSTAQATDSEYSIPGFLTDQIVQPVRWEESMQLLRLLGVEEILEMGPGKVLAGLHKRIDREMKIKSISNVAQFKEALK